MRGLVSAVIVVVPRVGADRARGCRKVAVSLARRRPRPATARSRPAVVDGRVGSGRRRRPRPTLPVRTRTPRSPTRCAPRTSASGVVADHRDRARRDPAAEVVPRRRRAPGGTRPATACRATSARRPVLYSRPTTNAPASSVTPSGVNHHGLRCIARNAAPSRISRNAIAHVRGRTARRRRRRGRPPRPSRPAPMPPPRASAGAGRRTRVAHPGAAMHERSAGRRRSSRCARPRRSSR